MGNKKFIEELKDTTKVLKTDDIKSVLDSALAYNLSQKEQGKEDFVNILLIGEDGAGRSTITSKWLKENKINHIVILPDAENMLLNGEYEALDRPNCVLFLRHFDSAPKETRANFLDFIKTRTKPADEEIWERYVELVRKESLRFVGNKGESLEDVIKAHTAPADPSEGKRKLNNFLFTIATAFPNSSIYNKCKFDDEELTCFKRVEVVMTPQKMLEYVTGEFNRILVEEDDSKEIAEYKCRLNLAQALLTNKNFQFTNDTSKLKRGERIISYSSFMQLLLVCDGTKEDFLKNAPSIMGKNTAMFEEILKDYVDKN